MILTGYSARYERELFEHVLPFWLSFSLDRENGGYFTCLDREGRIYDDRKYVWLNGRAVWTFSRLCRMFGPRPEWAEFATSCLEFLRAHAYAPDGTVYFSLTRDGQPAFQQRKPYSAVFLALGLIEYAKAFGKDEYLHEGAELFWKIRRWIDEPEALGRPQYGGKPMSQLADIMVISLLAQELSEVLDDARYGEQLDWCLNRVKDHFDADRGVLRENAVPGEKFPDTPEGRFFCSGSAAEVAWFLLHVLEKRGDAALEKLLLDAIDESLKAGWDEEHGGLYYFQDLAGRPLLQLEADMKLWWPHTEGIYASILAYTKTGDEKWLRWLERLDAYAFAHFADAGGLEWFGYCDRSGRRTSDLKGNNYKGAFHVPRFLMFSLERIPLKKERR